MIEFAAESALIVNSPRDGGQSIIIKSYLFLILDIEFFNKYSLSEELTNSISIPTKSMCAGIISK